MQLSVDELFKYSIVISRMPSRLELLKKSFTLANLPLPAVHMEPMRTCRHGTESCKQTHCKAAKYALENNWPCVLVFEDDAWPRRNARQILEKLLPTIDEKKLSLLSIGYWGGNFDENDIVNEYWKRAWNVVGFQAYIICRRNLWRFAQGFNGKHIDKTVSAYAEQLFNCKMYVTRSTLFMQYTPKTEEQIDRRDYFEERYGYAVDGYFRQDISDYIDFPTIEEVLKKAEKIDKTYADIPTVYADII